MTNEQKAEIQKAIDILTPICHLGGQAPEEPQGNETDVYYDAFEEGVETGALGSAIGILREVVK